MLNSPDNPHSSSDTEFLARHLALTDRQAQVLHWLAEGKTNQEIAHILDCSFFTVKNHVKAIFAQLGVSSRVGAAAAAYRAHFSNASEWPGDKSGASAKKPRAKRKAAARKADRQ